MTVFYHGNSNKFAKFKQFEKWKAFDGVMVERPVWLSPNKDFAKLYARPSGYVYIVDYKVGKSFPDEDIVVMKGRYNELTSLGKDLLEVVMEWLSRTNQFTQDEFDNGTAETEAEEIVHEIAKCSYGTMETSWMMNWLTDNGYTSFKVTGDGPTNLAVMDVENIEILSVESVTVSESRLNGLIDSLVREQLGLLLTKSR